LKNVKGHKTDVVDSKWLQFLHSIGLLSNSFQPDIFTYQLRVYARHRRGLIEDASKYINKMNKTLVLMNIQLKAVLSDITGVSGIKVIESILAGERNPEQLEKLVHGTCKSKREDIIKALHGDWRAEYLFELKDCYDLYNYLWEKIRKIDLEIEALLKEISSKNQGTSQTPKYNPDKRKSVSKNAPGFDVASYSYEMSDGVDLTQIPGVSLTTVLTLLTETGIKLSMFKSAKHFASWLGFAPNRKITGGKVMSSHTRIQTSPLAKMLREASNAAGNSKTRLGDFFRRISFRKGRMVAIIATARKIAVIIFTMLQKKEPYRYEYSQEDTDRLKSVKIKQIAKTIQSYNISKNDLNLIIG
jgi:hypothetical protein